MVRNVSIAIALVLCWAVLGGNALASSCTRGVGYGAALQAKRAVARNESTRPPLRSQAERDAMRVWGRATGRWWDECARYWPRRELSNCMRCIHYESHGNPSAVNPSGATGLFQLVGFPATAKYPLVNIRFAYRLWLSRGWQPWVVM